MEHNQAELDFEYRRLEHTLSIAKKHLSSARLRSEDNKAAILSAKQEMREDTSHSISGLWSMDNFHELVELSQYANPVSEKVSEYERDANNILALERLINSPYFARIDFKFDDEDSFETIYIGRSSLQDDETHEIYVYDWRSPLSSVFYSFGTGKVFYESPGGRITGEVNLKRQYEINKGKLDYFFDADIQIIDEFLRKLLSQNASSKMKTIVETIQRDQDMIIRDMEMDLLMVQGAAGSGKTSVALHRVAYLMYQGLAAKLSSNDIVIISPHTLFEKYIANVLPELGERNAHSLVFDEILRKVLQCEAIQTRNQFLEALLSPGGTQDGTLLKKSMAFKGSSQFIEILKRFIDDLPHRWIQFSDIYYDGKTMASRQLLKAKLLKDYKQAPLNSSLKQLEKSILKSVRQQRKSRLEKLKTFISEQTGQDFAVEEAARRLSILESTALLHQIRKFTEFDCTKLYQKLFSDKNHFYRLARGIQLPDCIEEIIDFTCDNLKKDYLPYDDALALAFLHLKTKGYSDYKDIKQVVIDEAQDYYPLHFEILHALFPKSRYTILGDIKQTIGKQEDLSLYDQASKLFSKQNSTLVTLDKSFRCTKEILTYSTKFLDPGFKLSSFSREGDEPGVFTAPNQAALDQLMIHEINTCREKGYQSIGLICKTEQDAGSLYQRLKDQIPIQVIKDDVQIGLNGVFTIPVYLSKGLEFDAVLICNADQEHYYSEDDKNLLYIACTRALRRLNLFYTRDISPLL
ncbi:MAG TPA: AAA family ATPase [Desulfitobacterium dehalogenans]|uniref:AAA family ATPase n=1 Tax=Desulfitobacterium dehalogenans TaxID=36854 RepID=A0A7C6Z3T1_9FIRM|nr:AAA family ATPase [Desulfitobacterium dehalogenans]